LEARISEHFGGGDNTFGGMLVADDLSYEQTRFLSEVRFRERELSAKEAELELKKQEIELRKKEVRRALWKEPLFLAIVAATIAALGNVGATYYTGTEQQTLERSRAETGRILEVIKTNDPDKAAANLHFLIDVGLLSDEKVKGALETYLKDRQRGQGVALPVAVTSPSTTTNLGHSLSLYDSPYLALSYHIRLVCPLSPMVRVETYIRNLDFILSRHKNAKPTYTYQAPRDANNLLFDQVVTFDIEYKYDPLAVPFDNLQFSLPSEMMTQGAFCTQS
jgi:hypothetical protein